MLRMPRFEVSCPESLPEALALLAEADLDTRVMAGGTDLLVALKNRLETPQRVVSLARVDGLEHVTEQEGSLAIGARVTLAQLGASDLVRRLAPALGEAARSVASPQVRQVATLGGNALLSTRCRYYNQSHFWRKALGFCLKKDGTLCHVVEGGRKCVAAASGDTAPALLTLGARVTLESQHGVRALPLLDLYRNDGVANTVLRPDELLTELVVPAQRPGHRGAYEKLRVREAIDYPLLGVAVRLDVDPDSGVVTDVDVVLTALQAKPRRVARIDSLVVGVPIHGEAFEAAAAQLGLRARDQCHPVANVPGDPEYRRRMVPVLVRRALLRAAGAA